MLLGAVMTFSGCADIVLIYSMKFSRLPSLSHLEWRWLHSMGENYATWRHPRSLVGRFLFRIQHIVPVESTWLELSQAIKERWAYTLHSQWGREKKPKISAFLRIWAFWTVNKSSHPNKIWKYVKDLQFAPRALLLSETSTKAFPSIKYSK